VTVNNPTLTINDVSASEGNSGTTTFTFTVTKSGSGAATVNYATANGTTNPATGGAACTGSTDYVTITSGTLSFASADTTKTIAVTVCGDTVYESNETFFVNLSSPSGATITDNQGVGTINNDDTAPALSINDVTLSEGNAGTTSFNFTVTKAGSTEVNATVSFATANGITDPATGGGVGTCSATSGTPDYETKSGSLTFLPADTTKTITVLVCGDTVYEKNQTFFVNLSTPGDATISDNQGVGTITNDDIAPSLAINDVSANEGDSGTTDFTFTVTKTGGTEVDSTVNFATADGTTDAATGGSGSCNAGSGTPDYLSQNGTLTLLAADPSKTITVKVCGDTVYELNQTFFVNLSTATESSISDNQGLGTIANDDAKPTLAIADLALPEGNSGTKDFVFNVTKAGATEVNVTVDFVTADGGPVPASSGAACGTTGTPDYFTGNGTLTFNPADTTMSITVRVCGETVYEKNQTFLVNLSNETHATFSDSQALGTINNDDAAPTLAIDDVTQAEDNAGMTDFTFTVSKTGSTEVDATVAFATADGTTYAATGNAGPCSASSGTPDYLSQSGGSLTFLPANASKNITVKVCGDTVYEKDQTFFVNLSSAADATITDNQGVGTITNDDAAPTLAINDATVTEGNAGMVDVIFTVTKTGATEVDPIVNFATADGTTNPATGTTGPCSDTSGTPDYLSKTGILTLPAADGSKTITVKACGDTVYELDQTFFVNLSIPVDASITDNQGLGTITNDDAKPALSIGDVSLAEGNSGTTNFNFVVSKTGLTELPIAVDYSTAPGTASAGGSCIGTGTPDYVTTSGVLNIPAASPSETITIAVCGEAVYELDQTFFVNLTDPPTNASIADGQAIGTIVNDDAPPSFSIDDIAKAEGNSGTTGFIFTVTKTGATELDASVNVATAAGPSDPATANGACGAGVDYIGVATTTLMFLPADTAKTVTVAVCGDTIYERNQTFVVDLSSPVQATVGDGQGLGTINNDDAAPMITIDDVTHLEGNTGTINYEFTVTKTGATEVPATVNFATADGTLYGATGGMGSCSATSGMPDYLTQTGSLTFLPAEMTKSVTVQGCGDTVFEQTQTFFVNLSGAADATITDPQGLGTITNDDTAPTLSINNVTANEGNSGTSNFTFTVMKTGLTEVAATVNYATAAGITNPATAGATCGTGVDYKTTSNTLTIPASEATKDLVVPVCGELVYELNQTFVVNLTAPSNATITGSQGVGTILNDDSPTTVILTPAPNAINEGGSATLNGSFSNVEIGQQHQVDINWGDGSTNTTLTLLAGASTFSTSHQYKDDSPTATASDPYTISVTLTTLGPPDFVSGNGTTTVTVNNVAPAITLNDPGSVFQVNTPITFSATYTDPGATSDDYTAVWTFDGASCPAVTSPVAVIEPNSSPGSVTIGCKFSVPGVYQIVLKVTDDDGGVGTADKVAGLTAQVVIYDPNGGFVTGGGWINSPPGAFPANPSLVGKANFGFVSKYQKGATIPTGETEFQFQTGNLNFHSTAYEWLVVAGARAQYKGSGTIKGMNGTFGFMLTAIDGQVAGGGGVDKFRMKIWDSNGAIVYDNQLGLNDDGDPTTTLGGGSIVVHK